MMPARHWKDRRAFWPALVFWVWLASFAFGFAASDLFHAPNCPEQLALRDATRDSSAHWSASHAVDVDVDCAACAFQLVAHGVLALPFIFAAPLFLSVALTALFAIYISLRASVSCARGPPELVAESA